MAPGRRMRHAAAIVAITLTRRRYASVRPRRFAGAALWTWPRPAPVAMTGAGRYGAGAGGVGQLAARRAPQVWGPTIPSTASPFARWKAVTAARVWGPKSPSTVTS